jgi:hypothetical protein
MIGIDYAISAVAKLADDAIVRIWPDATEVEKAKLSQISQEIQNQYQLQLGQIDINKVEANNKSLFITGWRPAVGWSCVAGFGYEFVLRPIVVGVSMGLGFPIPLPGIETGVIETLLYAMLGLGSMRTVERLKGVHRS